MIYKLLLTLATLFGFKYHFIALYSKDENELKQLLPKNICDKNIYVWSFLMDRIKKETLVADIMIYAENISLKYNSLRDDNSSVDARINYYKDKNFNDFTYDFSVLIEENSYNEELTNLYLNKIPNYNISNIVYKHYNNLSNNLKIRVLKQDYYCIHARLSEKDKKEILSLLCEQNDFAYVYELLKNANWKANFDNNEHILDAAMFGNIWADKIYKEYCNI